MFLLIFNRNYVCNDLWGIERVDGLQLDFIPLIITFRAQFLLRDIPPFLHSSIEIFLVLLRIPTSAVFLVEKNYLKP